MRKIICHIGAVSFTKSKTSLKYIGGIQGYIKELILFSIQRGLKIHFFGNIHCKIHDKSIKYHHFQIRNNSQFLISLFLRGLFTNIPKNAIIHAHRPDDLAALLYFRKRKSIVTLHGQQAKTFSLNNGWVKQVVYNHLEKRAFKRTKFLIAVDHITYKFYTKKYPKYKNKISVIPTGINMKLFRPLDKSSLRKKFGYTNEDKIILYVGRIAPPKKVDVILKAFSALWQSDPKFKLIIVGDGSQLSEIKILTKKLSVSGHVLFKHAQNHFNLVYYYNLADVSVLCSENEGSPLSVKESLACGIPVVANPVGDIPLVIQDGYNGYISKNNNHKDLAMKLNNVFVNKRLVSNNCIQSVKNYSMDLVNKRILDLYDTISNEL